MRLDLLIVLALFSDRCDCSTNTTKRGPELDLKIIDLEDSLAAQKVLEACMKDGAFRLTGHALTANRVAEVGSLVDQFFDLSDAEKRLTPRLDNDGDPRGYSGYEEENVYALSGTDGPPDPIEKFSIGGSNNIFPARPEGMKLLLENFFAESTALARQIFRLLAIALELPDPEFFAPFLTHSRDSMRFLNYPAYTRPLAGQLRMAPHTDMGVFSLIFPTDAPGGLEYLFDGAWRAVQPGAGVIVHIGDTLMEWTNGRLLSNVHRVAIPDPAQAAESRRRSIVFFQMLNFETPMRPLEIKPSLRSEVEISSKTKDKGEPEPVINFGEYLSKKMGAMNRKETAGSAAIYDMKESEKIYRGQVEL